MSAAITEMTVVKKPNVFCILTSELCMVGWFVQARAWAIS